MVQRCKKKGLVAHLSRFQDFKAKEKFSVILALSSLLHVKKSEFRLMLEKIHDMLDTNGLFLLSLAQGFGEEIVKENVPRFFAFYTKDEVLAATRNLFELIDFSDEYVSKNNRKFMIFAFHKI